METASKPQKTTGMPWNFACQLKISGTNWKWSFVTLRQFSSGENYGKWQLFVAFFCLFWLRGKFWPSRWVRNGPKPWHSSSRMNSRFRGSRPFQNRVILARVMVKNVSQCNQFTVRFEAKWRFFSIFFVILDVGDPLNRSILVSKAAQGSQLPSRVFRTKIECL